MKKPHGKKCIDCETDLRNQFSARCQDCYEKFIRQLRQQHEKFSSKPIQVATERNNS